MVDVCSCSPRDYTAMASRRQQARDRHNHQPRVVGEGEGEGGREGGREERNSKDQEGVKMEG